MADFIFIRHAESNNNQLAAIRFPNKEDRPEFLKVREANPELTADGRAQTSIVAKRIVNEYLLMQKEEPVAERPSGVTSSFVPRPVTEIWSSYLTRAIETAVAIQDAWREALGDAKLKNADLKDTPGVPPIRMNSDATEVGGHYQFNHDVLQQQGTPGFTNKEVAARWPNATFIFDQPENDAEGWNKLKIQEPKIAAEERAGRLVKKMETAATEASAAHPNSTSLADRPVIVVITHGDFFRYLLQSIAGRAPVVSPSATTEASSPILDTPMSPLKAAGNVQGNVDETLLKSLLPSNRTCDEHIIARASVKQNIGNTSLSHFGIDVIGSGGDIRFAWQSAFMADNSHVHKVASQAAAMKRYQDLKCEFEDPETGKL